MRTQLYGHAFRRSQAHTAMRKRTDPITVISDEALKTIGDYFPLVGYEPAVDCLIRSLCRLHQGFDTSITRQLYKELQLLRIVGAPGLGKSTFMSHVWGMLVPRLAQLLEQGLPATAAWEGHSREGLRQLHERMEKAWAAGPLVFRQDMSNEGAWLHQTGTVCWLLGWVEAVCLSRHGVMCITRCISKHPALWNNLRLLLPSVAAALLCMFYPFRAVLGCPDVSEPA